MVRINPLDLDGIVEIVPHRHRDQRGFMSEVYRKSTLQQLGHEFEFVQENHSLSLSKGVVRGLHYQLPPRAQDKLVRVVRGRIFDVAVDIRKSSANFGKWIGIELSAEAGNQLFIPKGFAHGFLTLEGDCEIVYKTTDYYAPDCDRAIRFDDPDIAVAWPAAARPDLLSDKDRKAPLLRQADIFD